MSKPALTPDFFRDFRDIQNRLAAMEAKLSGPRFYGPFTTGNVSLSAGQTTTTWTHNLNLPGPYGVVGWVVLVSGAIVPRWAVSALAANVVTFGIDMGGTPGTTNFAISGYVVV